MVVGGCGTSSSLLLFFGSSWLFGGFEDDAKIYFERLVPYSKHTTGMRHFVVHDNQRLEYNTNDTIKVLIG